MAKSSLIVTTKDHITGNTQQKTITDINPQANDAHLKTWGQMVAGLSKDSYVKSDRVDKRNLDTDSKIDYEPQFQTSKLDEATGENVFNRTIPASENSFVLNLAPFIATQAGAVLPFRYQNGTNPLIQAEAPVLTITTSNSNFSVEHRNTTYGTAQNPSVSSRYIYQMDLNIYGDIVAGDSFTVTTNVNGDATHNPYTRTVKYTFVEWTAPEEGGEG